MKTKRLKLTSDGRSLESDRHTQDFASTSWRKKTFKRYWLMFIDKSPRHFARLKNEIIGILRMQCAKARCNPANLQYNHANVQMAGFDFTCRRIGAVFLSKRYNRGYDQPKILRLASDSLRHLPRLIKICHPLSFS